MSIIKNTEELNNLLDAVQKLPVKKDEQEKVVDITENGTTVVTPDEGMTLSGVTVNVAIESGGTEEIEALIDQSEVLDSTDETVTVTDKVEALIHYVDVFKRVYKLSYYGIKSIEHIDFYIDFVVFELDFQYSSVKTIVGVDVSKLNTCRNMFAYCRSLMSIQRPFDMSKFTAWSMTDMFFGCISLVDVRFVKETIKESITIPSPVLSIGNVFNLTDTENVGSVQSIINGLATLAEGAAAQTLTLSKNLPLTEEQKQAITTAVNNKGWTLAFA